MTGRRVVVRAHSSAPRQLDCDLIDPGKTMKIHIRRRALLLCVPQPAGDPDLAYDSAAAKRAAEGVRAAAEKHE